MNLIVRGVHTFIDADGFESVVRPEHDQFLLLLLLELWLKAAPVLLNSDEKQDALDSKGISEARREHVLEVFPRSIERLVIRSEACLNRIRHLLLPDPLLGFTEQLVVVTMHEPGNDTAQHSRCTTAWLTGNDPGNGIDPTLQRFHRLGEGKPPRSF